MSTILFDKAVFGPVRSRRLGLSLGINLLPTNGKVCSFDCLYCECGFNRKAEGEGATHERPVLPTRLHVSRELTHVLKKMLADGEEPDVITFAGNGEPTLHPDFAAIVDDTLELRDQYAPNARVCVLSNATRLSHPDVAHALSMVDEAILKIDSGREETIMMLDRPNGSYSLEEVVDNIVTHREALGDALTIQTMFVSWTQDGVTYDNTCPEDVEPWMEILQRIRPPRLMIYTIDRETPYKEMSKTPKATLDGIAERAREVVPEVSVAY